MRIQKETQWLCDHAKDLEKFSGKWVAFSLKGGVVAKGRSADQVLKESKKKNEKDPFLFHVPSKKTSLPASMRPWTKKGNIQQLAIKSKNSTNSVNGTK